MNHHQVKANNLHQVIFLQARPNVDLPEPLKPVSQIIKDFCFISNSRSFNPINESVGKYVQPLYKLIDRSMPGCFCFRNIHYAISIVCILNHIIDTFIDQCMFTFRDESSLIFAISSASSRIHSIHPYDLRNA